MRHNRRGDGVVTISAPTPERLHLEDQRLKLQWEKVVNKQLELKMDKDWKKLASHTGPGITITPDQQDTIQHLVSEGRILEAQRIILDILDQHRARVKGGV